MSKINTISQSCDLLRNIDVGEILRLRERNAELERELAEANAKLDAARIRVDEAIQQTKELIELYRKQTP